MTSEKKAAHNTGFAAMLADEQIPIFLLAVSSGSVRRNSIELL